MGFLTQSGEPRTTMSTGTGFTHPHIRTVVVDGLAFFCLQVAPCTPTLVTPPVLAAWEDEG